MLDTLAEKGVKAMFFVTKNFIVNNPEYVKRMKDEGHLVGNHTVRHLSSPTLTPEELANELYEVAIAMEEYTGYSIDPYFRPPMGEYSERTLKVTQDMGYTSVFWSIAYYDYDTNDQPGKAYVVDHFKTYHHNGCIALIHNTSESNEQALGDVLDLLKDEGYRFGTLAELGN
jgi:peptidoglycan-N-acetylmuramic acid deacetylase